ncbi:MAG: DUF1835 domain-containing protein [Nitrospiraceae bacterium]
MLHIRCGDDILEKLKEAGLPGEFIRWADALCQGPTPAGLEPDEWRRMRARHAEAYYGVSFEMGMDFLGQDQDLEQFKHHDEVLLWFEHDLFDQIVLVYLLNWFSKRDLSRRTVFLICPDRHMFLTTMGEAVLSEKEDHIKLNGIDRWLGGIHLRGSRVPWRWSHQRKRLAEGC